MSSKNKNKNLIIIAASLLLLLTFTIVFSALLPTIFQLHSSLFLSTIAICASIAISVIFTTCIKILWKLTSSSDQTETQETQETQAQSSVESGVPYRSPYLRTPSLPVYENAVTQSSPKSVETPPPTYNEITPNFPHWM